MIIEVQYRDGRHDHVDNLKLDELISLDQVRQFYRPSEQRWIDVEVGSMRGKIKSYRRHENKWVNVDVEGQRAWELRAYEGMERRYRRYPL
jgi:hypothetical protein